MVTADIPKITNLIFDIIGDSKVSDFGLGPLIGEALREGYFTCDSLATAAVRSMKAQKSQPFEIQFEPSPAGAPGYLVTVSASGDSFDAVVSSANANYRHVRCVRELVMHPEIGLHTVLMEARCVRKYGADDAENRTVTEENVTT